MERIRRLKAGIFQALGHPTRLAILEAISGSELTVTAIATQLKGEQANISQHLTVLRTRGLVVARKSANHVLYSLRDARLLEVLATMRDYCAAHVAEDQQLLRGLRGESRKL